MATINYNGMVLEEFTSDTPVFWDTPRKALCWNEDNNHYWTEEYLIGYVPRSDDGLAISDHTTWSHCALLHTDRPLDIATDPISGEEAP